MLRALSKPHIATSFGITPNWQSVFANPAVGQPLRRSLAGAGGCNSQIESVSLAVGARSFVARRRHSVDYDSSSRLAARADGGAILLPT
jgi:hypothetical protein